MPADTTTASSPSHLPELRFLARHARVPVTTLQSIEKSRALHLAARQRHNVARYKGHQHWASGYWRTSLVCGGITVVGLGANALPLAESGLLLEQAFLDLMGHLAAAPTLVGISLAAICRTAQNVSARAIRQTAKETRRLAQVKTPN